MRTSDAFPSKYLKCSDLQGKTVGVTIDSVTIEVLGIGEDKSKKLIVYFQGKEKGLVCNRTNANMIEEITGSGETDDWHGKRIALRPAKVDFQGRRVDAIRVDFPASGASAPVMTGQRSRQPQPPPPPEFEREPGMDDDMPDF